MGKDVFLITEGCFFGFYNGCFVGHICPEAADGGPIAFLQPDGRIWVDVPAHRVNALGIDFPQQEALGCTVFEAPSMPSFLHQYARNVLPSSIGAVIPSRPPDAEELSLKAKF